MQEINFELLKRSTNVGKTCVHDEQLKNYLIGKIMYHESKSQIIENKNGKGPIWNSKKDEVFILLSIAIALSPLLYKLLRLH